MKWHPLSYQQILNQVWPLLPVSNHRFQLNTATTPLSLHNRFSERGYTSLKEVSAGVGHAQNTHHNQPDTQHHGSSDTFLQDFPQSLDYEKVPKISHSKLLKNTLLVSSSFASNSLLLPAASSYLLFICRTLLALVDFISTFWPLENWWPFSL